MVESEKGGYKRENIFGSCDEDKDCTDHLENSECRTMKTGTSYCRCKSNSCYDFNVQKGEHECAVKGNSGTSVQHVMDVVDRHIVGLKMSIGDVSIQLQGIADEVGKEPASTSSLMQR